MRILVVDDEPSLRQLLQVLLTREGYSVVIAASVEEARQRLDPEIDLVISDMKLGRGSGMDVLRSARELAPLPPEVILITAFGTPAAAVEAMRAGAYDYICKPFDNEELKLLVQKALEKRQLRNENTRLRRRVGGQSWVGTSQAMRDVWALVEKVAASRSTVLISGESGTGKELVARAIHQMSPRASQPFLAVNCAAIAEGVLESELFGHVRGAFTGAHADRQGMLVAAGEGTVFLDEIGEIPPSMQVKLLRVLQEKKVKPVGSSQEIPFSARVLAATNRRLDQEVADGRFREDLFYRLNVISIELPPLRHRREDIPELASHFLQRISEELARPTLRFTPEAMEVLAQYRFPGNVRQLQNIVERAATLAESDLLGPDTLPPGVRGIAVPEATEQGSTQLPEQFSLERHLDDAERRYLLAALAKSQGVKSRAAELLGLSFRSFRYRLAKHGIGDGDDPRPHVAERDS